MIKRNGFGSKYIYVPINNKSRDSVVGIATGYGLDDREVGVRVPPNLLSNVY
jgi:hypothetical protein